LGASSVKPTSSFSELDSAVQQLLLNLHENNLAKIPQEKINSVAGLGLEGAIKVLGGASPKVEKEKKRKEDEGISPPPPPLPKVVVPDNISMPPGFEALGLILGQMMSSIADLSKRVNKETKPRERPVENPSPKTTAKKRRERKDKGKKAQQSQEVRQDAKKDKREKVDLSDDEILVDKGTDKTRVQKCLGTKKFSEAVRKLRSDLGPGKWNIGKVALKFYSDGKFNSQGHDQDWFKGQADLKKTIKSKKVSN